MHDPILSDAYRRMALHYGFLISPTIPHTPRHKGKVESGVHYIQRNFMAGQAFVDIQVGNVHLRDWILNTAGLRKHGTTGEAPLRLFHETEKACLQSLPAEPFQLLEIRPVKVHPDCHVVISGSFYSVPFGYVGQELAAYVSENFVEIYQGLDLVTTHPRSTRPGQWHTRMEDYPPAKAAYLIRTPQYCKNVGSEDRPVYAARGGATAGGSATRPAAFGAGHLAAGRERGRQTSGSACARAAYFGDVRYRQIKLILNAALDREPLPRNTARPACTQPHFRPPWRRILRAAVMMSHPLAPKLRQLRLSGILDTLDVRVYPRLWLNNWLRSNSWRYCSTMNWNAAASNTRY